MLVHALFVFRQKSGADLVAAVRAKERAKVKAEVRVRSVTSNRRQLWTRTEAPSKRCR